MTTESNNFNSSNQPKKYHIYKVKAFDIVLF